MDDQRRRARLVAHLVSVVERVGDARADPGRHHERKTLVRSGRARLLERAPAEELHRQVVAPRVVPEPVDRHDVRVREARRDPRLVEEHGHEPLLATEFGADHLERDEPVGLSAQASREHVGHSASANRRDDVVLTERVELGNGGRGGHGRLC